jgi:hypothetical protein
VLLAAALVLPAQPETFFSLSNIAVALSFFLAGAIATGQIGHVVGDRNRLWLILCNFIQTYLVFAAAAIQYVYGIQSQGSQTLAVLAILAFSAGSQVVQTRALNVLEINTANATSPWVELMIDPNLLARNNRSRTRRAAFLAALILGSLVGGSILTKAGSATVLACSGAGKLLVTIMYFFNAADKRDKKKYLCTKGSV